MLIRTCDRFLVADSRKDVLRCVVDSPAMSFITHLLSLALAVSLQSVPATVEPGFISLFNGKDFTGWKIGGPAEAFKISDAAIIANEAANHRHTYGSVRHHS